MDTDRTVAIAVGCAVPDCGRVEEFHGASGAEARERARKAGWRHTPGNESHFGLCPDHAGPGAPDDDTLPTWSEG